MFQKILVATDFSDVSECVLGSLGGLREAGVQTVRLVYCVNAGHVGGPVHDVTEQAAPALERQRRILEKQGFETESDLAVGLPHIEIERQAKENGCGLIAVAAHGENVSSEITLCGVACEVLHGSSLPILLLRLPCACNALEKTCEAWRSAPFRHVLYPTDFSDNAEHAYEMGLRPLAAKGVGEVTLMHVQDRVRIDRHLQDRLEEFNRIDTERLERIKSDLILEGVETVHIEISYGHAKKEIVDRIAKGDISLVVMSSHGRGYIGEIFLGSVSHAVARHSTAPILLIPAMHGKC